MKHLKLFFALFAMLALGVSNAWGAEKTITLTYSDFGLTNSYAQKTATVDGIGFTVNQGYKGSGNVIQMNSSKGAGVLFNTTSIAGLKSITVNVSSGSKTYTITSGTAQTPSGNSQTGTATKTFSIPSGDTYFQLKVSGASYFSSIVITYDDSNSGGETPGTGGETPGTGGGSANVTYDFTKIDGFSSWPTSYASGKGDVVYTEATVKFTGAVKQTQTITDCPVTKGGQVQLVLNEAYADRDITNITFVCRQWGTKSQTITLHYSTDKGVSYTTTEITSTNFTISSAELPEGTNAVKITFSSSSNQVGIESVTFSLSSSEGSSGGETPEPETPATELTNDHFAWSAATAEATMGASNTFPTLTNTLSVPVTYESSTPATATIAADGSITLVAPGTTTISAKFAGGEVSGTKYAEKTVEYTLTVEKAPASPTENVYVKVTSTAGITDGEYLIVYEDATNTPPAPLAFNGALETLDASKNTIAVEISNSTIAGNTDIDAALFTIDVTAGTLKSASGKYIGVSSNNNGLKVEDAVKDYKNAFSIDDKGNAVIAADFEGSTMSLRYNNTDGDNNLRFRYYKNAGQQPIALYKKVDPNAVVEPVFTLAAGEYYGTQSVEITCATAGAEIYYTLNGTDPTSASTKYTGAISIASTTTIKAVAIKGENSSAVVSATYTILAPLATMQAIFDKATAVGKTATPVHITMNNWVITGVKGSNAYLTDGTKGLIIYTASHGFNVGDILSGTVACKVQLFKGSAELTELTSTAEGLTVSSGGEVTPVEVADISSLTGANTGSVIKITGVHDKNNIISGVKLYNALYEFNDLTSGKKYSVTGVYLLYEETQEILPRSEADIVEVPVPTLSATITDADFGKVAINGTRERTLTLNGSLLTSTVSLAIEGEGAEYFTLASESVTPTDGNITDAKIKITYKPTAEGTHNATLKITSDNVAVQTITLQGQAVQQHTVDFYVNKEKQTELAKKVLSGEKLTEIPTATSCDPLEYPTFIGWSASEITGTTDVEPTDLLDLNTTITADCKYYAVFAKETSSTTSTGITYEVTLKNTNFITNYNERTINITANEVGGDGTVEVSFQSVGVMKCTDASKGAVMQFRKKGSSQPGIIYNTTDLGQINSITIGTGGTNNIASIVIGSTQQPTTQEDNEGFFLITNGTSVSYIPSITINFTQNSSVSTTTYTYLTTCESATPTYTVTYNLDGGESTCETSVVVEQDGELTLCDAPTKTGHKFLKWKDQNDNEYAAGAKITVSEDLTLTAQWQVNSYDVTWMSLGDEVLVNSTNYNIQPTKPTTAPSYTCGIGSKEFVGWTTQEIDGAGVPANLYTDEFPVVTEAITYHAVFASKIEGGGSMSKAVSLTNGETVYLATESGIGVTGANTSTNKDATVSTTQGDWLPFTVVTNGLQYQFKTGDNYITAAAKSFKITETPSDFAFENGYIVYNVPSGSDAGDYVLLVNNNDDINTYYRFYKESNMSNSKYETFYVYKNPTHTDYTTSCPVLELTEGENTLTDGVTADVKVNRSFDKDKLYTLSLPFALDASQVETIFGAGTILYQFAQLVKENEELVLYFSKPSAIAAATPYLIQPTQDVAAGFTVEDATISTTPNNISFTVGATTITMKPILSATAGEKTNGNTEYWLADNTYLYNNANTVLSLRALFDITTISGMPPRCRVAFGENVETGVDNITNGENTTIKVIENGQLIIIRNGEKFNAQGIKL